MEPWCTDRFTSCSVCVCVCIVMSEILSFSGCYLVFNKEDLTFIIDSSFHLFCLNARLWFLLQLWFGLQVLIYWYIDYTLNLFQKSDWKLHQLECRALSKLDKNRLKSLTPSIRLMVKLFIREKLQSEKVSIWYSLHGKSLFEDITIFILHICIHHFVWKFPYPEICLFSL